LPVTSGELQLEGVHRPILIRRDRHGVPYIEAENDSDAWYALGFCQGQDRGFQLEGLVRVVRGTLAELVGPDGLPVDQLSRRIGFRQSADKQLPAQGDDIRGMLDAFTRGVNAGVRRGCRRLPHEFTLLRAKPTVLEPADVLGLLKLISFLLASNWDSELVRLKTLTEDGPEALAALDPSYPEWLPVTTPGGALSGPVVDRLAGDVALFAAVAGHGGGSNNWAVAPQRTASGRPILANDPHLASSLPPHWYLAHVRTPDWAVAGAAFAGAPGILVGHNDVCAWGVTAGLTDNTDLYLEEIGPDGRSVRRGNEWVPCAERVEVIRVKGEEPAQVRVLETPHGPIIGPALAGEVGAIALQATWLAPRPVRGCLTVHHARDFDGFRRCFEQWPSLPLNLAYADANGNIGWQLVGDAPRRRQGWGTLPLPGADPANGWEAKTVPFADLPHAFNPTIGYVATANNKPTADGEGPYLGTDWIDGYRAARIAELLATRQDWDVPATLALQMDQASIPWREMRSTVLAATPQTAVAQQGLELLAAWDGVIAADSPAAAVYELFVSEMVRRVVVAKAPKTAAWALGQGFTPLAPHSLLVTRRTGYLVRLLREQPEDWFGGPWSAEVAAAVGTAVQSLQDRFGSSVEQWQWGKVRPLTLLHPVGERPPLDKVFHLGPFPWGGDAATVAQAAVPPAEPTANPPFVASLRVVLDVGNWEENRFVLPGGQSGNPLSPHYADQFPLWQRGLGVRMPWSAEEVSKAAQTTLRLVPANP
jgi:penicillin amidase